MTGKPPFQGDVVLIHAKCQDAVVLPSRPPADLLMADLSMNEMDMA